MRSFVDLHTPEHAEGGLREGIRGDQNAGVKGCIIQTKVFGHEPGIWKNGRQGDGFCETTYCYSRGQQKSGCEI